MYFLRSEDRLTFKERIKNIKRSDAVDKIFCKIISVLAGYSITRGDFDTYKGNIPSVIVYRGIIKDVKWE